MQEQPRVLSLTGDRRQELPFQLVCNGLAVEHKGANTGQEDHSLRP